MNPATTPCRALKALLHELKTSSDMAATKQVETQIVCALDRCENRKQIKSK
jgi:hypothetical protein